MQNAIKEKYTSSTGKPASFCQKTARNQRVYDYIVSSSRVNGYPPSIREICAALGYKSTSSVWEHIQQLIRLGLLTNEPTKPRTYSVPRVPFPVASQRLDGSITTDIADYIAQHRTCRLILALSANRKIPNTFWHGIA